ncbi:MAG: DUF4863 family protein [Comamonadaceae bacterium]
MPSTELRQQITQLSAPLAGRELNAELDLWLNTEQGVGTASYRRLRESCEAGVAAGWLCNREGGGHP